MANKLGRNQPCKCGSEKKYKFCCWNKDQDILWKFELKRRKYVEFLKSLVKKTRGTV